MDDLKTLIVNLKILGSIEVGTKLSTRDRIFELSFPSIPQTLLRKFYYCENRNLSLEKIINIVKDLRKLMEYEDTSHLPYAVLNFKNKEEFNEYIKPIIKQTIVGLTNMRETYSDDKTYVAKLDLEIQTIERMLKTI